MRKILNKVVIFSTCLFITSTSIAADNGRGLYYVSGFYKHSRDIARHLKQKTTGANQSCGPTSMLFIENHFLRKSGIPSDLVSVTDATQALEQAYVDLSRPYNDTTSLTQLRNLARNYWNYSSKGTVRMFSSDSVVTNVGKLIKYLKQDVPAIVVLDSSFSRNPTRGGHNIDHLVVIYAYQRRRDDNGYSPLSEYNNHQNDRFYFFDPYYGKAGYFTRKELPYATDLTGFAFLAVSPDAVKID